MFCTQCGTQLETNAKFCTKCGQPASGDLAPEVSVNSTRTALPGVIHVADTKPLGTKWLKFWSYCSLPVGGVLGLLMSLGVPALGIIMIPMAILQFVVAYGLHYRKLWAWQWNWVLVIITFLSMLIPAPIPGSHGGGADLVIQFMIKLILASLIWMWPNHVYWKKRRALFTSGGTALVSSGAIETKGVHGATDASPLVSAPVMSIDSATFSPEKKLSSNYLVRHWRGELSLGITYWVNGSVLAGIIPVALIAVVGQMDEDYNSLRAISFSVLGVLLFSVIAWFWSIVGIWRSADRHASRGGVPAWANVAKFMVVAGVVAMANQLTANILPQAKELALIAIGQDPIGRITIKVATNGQSVIVNGTLREGSAGEIQKILDAAPGATALVLNSNGGRLLEAQQLARTVRNRNLDTYVEDQCVSACTYVFLAGKDRAATPNARIGFHRPSFPGFDADAERYATQEMLDVYRTAGLPETFVQRIGKTSHKDMWYPTRDELIASHVVTRVSLGGEVAMGRMWMRSKQEFILVLRSIPLYQAIEQRFPGTINEAMELGWAAKERGGSDADITNAMRSVIAEIYPKLIKTADVSTLDSYLKLMIDEMQAARAVSGEACTKLLATQLDITKTLPKEIVKREQKFLMQALATPPQTDMKSPDPAQFDRITQLVVTRMPQQYINVISNMEAYAGQPELVCGAIIAFYQGIDALPPHDRITALKGIFQGKEQ